MSNSPTRVEVGETTSFDVAAVGDWISDHVWLFLLVAFVAFVAFVFHLFRRGGFAEKLLEYRVKVKELDAKQLDDARELADIMRRKYDREDPLLPFDDPELGDQK